MIRIGIAILLSVLLVSCSSARIAQQLQQGKNNFEGGYYQDAFHQLLPLANEGSKEAQYAVGYMYYYGYGVSHDAESGLFWIHKSAEQNYAPAVQALLKMEKGSS